MSTAMPAASPAPIGRLERATDSETAATIQNVAATSLIGWMAPLKNVGLIATTDAANRPDTSSAPSSPRPSR